MSQIRDKKAHRKHIETMNPINAKSVQLIELHAFAYCLLCVYLSALLHLFKSVIICLSDTYINMCQLCNAMFHPLGQVFFKVKVLIFYFHIVIGRFYDFISFNKSNVAKTLYSIL